MLPVWNPRNWTKYLSRWLRAKMLLISSRNLIRRLMPETPTATLWILKTSTRTRSWSNWFRSRKRTRRGRRRSLASWSRTIRKVWILSRRRRIWRRLHRRRFQCPRLTTMLARSRDQLYSPQSCHQFIMGGTSIILRLASQWIWVTRWIKSNCCRWRRTTTSRSSNRRLIREGCRKLSHGDHMSTLSKSIRRWPDTPQAATMKTEKMALPQTSSPRVLTWPVPPTSTTSYQHKEGKRRTSTSTTYPGWTTRNWVKYTRARYNRQDLLTNLGRAGIFSRFLPRTNRWIWSWSSMSKELTVRDLHTTPSTFIRKATSRSSTHAFLSKTDMEIKAWINWTTKAIQMRK